MQQKKQRKAQMIQVTADAIKEMKIFAHSVAMQLLEHPCQKTGNTLSQCKKEVLRQPPKIEPSQKTKKSKVKKPTSSREARYRKRLLTKKKKPKVKKEILTREARYRKRSNESSVAASEHQTNVCFSLSKGGISSKDVALMRKRRQFVRSPDPRPCFG